MALFDFLKPKPRTIYDRMAELVERAVRESRPVLMTYIFANDYLPKKLYHDVDSIFPGIQRDGTSVVTRLYRELCVHYGVQPRSEDINALLVSHHPDVAGRDLYVIRYRPPPPIDPRATHPIPLPYYSVIVVTFTENTVGFDYIIFEQSKDGRGCFRSIGQDGTQIDLGVRCDTHPGSFFGALFAFLENYRRQPSYTGRPDENMTQEGRTQFIRRLVRERFKADPLAQLSAEIANESIDTLPEALIISTPDASLVAIAERFVGGHRKGLADAEIIELIHHEFKTAMEATTPFPFPPLPEALDLWRYARYFLDCQHSHGTGTSPISDDYIDYVFRETFRFYNFSGSPPRVVPPPHRY